MAREPGLITFRVVGFVPVPGAHKGCLNFRDRTGCVGTLGQLLAYARLDLSDCHARRFMLGADSSGLLSSRSRSPREAHEDRHVWAPRECKCCCFWHLPGCVWSVTRGQCRLPISKDWGTCRLFQVGCCFSIFLVPPSLLWHHSWPVSLWSCQECGCMAALLG